MINTLPDFDFQKEYLTRIPLSKIQFLKACPNSYHPHDMARDRNFSDCPTSFQCGKFVSELDVGAKFPNDCADFLNWVRLLDNNTFKRWTQTA